MNLRLAAMDDLPQLRTVYKEIIEAMDNSNIRIWDEIYPCEFFCGDIENGRLYLLSENNEIASAFALCDSHVGEQHIAWENNHAKAIYIDRFGVNVNYLRKGIGGQVLNRATALAKEKGAEYLRLFVVDINKPAINLYIKSGFHQAAGIYDEAIDDDLVLHEYGFEIKTSI